MEKPSQALKNYLSGNDSSPDEAIYSWASLSIHRKALQVLRLPKDKRLSEIENAPAYLQDRLKTEITRIYKCKV
jgi:hypothetical protein